MEGYFVKHRLFGLGKIVQANESILRVAFSDANAQHSFGKDAVGSDLEHHQLESGSYCTSSDGPCRVVRCTTGDNRGSREYEVRYDDGRIAVISETHLEPETRSYEYSDAARLLSDQEIDGYVVFRAREDFQHVHLRNLRNLGMHRAILSSRIDLHAHQISVALEVLGDTRKRYILADEVGLGKTIEAGIVIHELLCARPDARVLIVCPGTLTQQWLCEIYSKFGGRIFTLLDLHATDAIPWRTLRSAIVSTTRIAFDLGPTLSEVQWDMVVVDEAHHLLGTQYLYDFVMRLSRRVPWLLLLSALPAQRREDEFLRLLALLEPDRYGACTPEVVQEFRSLFEIQREVGRHLKLLRLRIDGVRSGEFTNDQMVQQLQRTLAHPCFASSQRLAKISERAKNNPSGAEKAGIEAVRIISDRYRINRRILRNRRQELLDRGELPPVRRIVEHHGYAPGPLESEALAAIARLLADFSSRATLQSVRTAFTQILLQSLVSPTFAEAFVERTIASEPAEISQKGQDFLGLGHLTGYEDWKRYQTLVRRSARENLDDDLLQDCLYAITSWNRSSERTTRFEQLRVLITALRGATPNAKLLVFAGFPGLAAELVVFLQNSFGSGHILQFTYNLPRETKEDAARKFEVDPAVWVLVSDESGGEGRNFQFASALIHVDHPWHASRVEQRIGRLDRLGRAAFQLEVVSHVLYCDDSVEAGLVRCYAEGLGVYTRSVSGLEFALRDTELRLTEVAALEGVEGLIAEIPSLQSRAEQERSRDDAEAVLDAASFDAGRAMRGKAVLAQSEIQSLLEQTFIRYFQCLSSKGSAVRWELPGLAHGFWRIRPDSVRAGLLASVADSPPMIGTFDRALAQKRLDLAYFQVGNPVYDELAGSLELNPAGKTYAIAGQTAATESWIGFEFSFRLTPNVSVLHSRPDLMARCSAMLTMSTFRVFISTDGIIEPDVETLTRIRKKFTSENKERCWHNLTKDKTATLDSVFPSGNWKESLSQLYKVAAEQARTNCESQVGNSIASDVQRLRRGALELMERGDVVAIENARELEMVAEALGGWQLRNDAAGLLAINIGLSQESQ